MTDIFPLYSSTKIDTQMTLFVLSKPLLYNISKPTCFRQQQKASISRIMAAYLKEHGPDEKKRIIRKKWKQEDSERLLKLVGQYGPKWKSFESEFPGRAASCIKSHYETRTGNSQLILTAEEKEILTREIESMQGDDVDWKMLQKSLLPSIRSITAIKKYYYGLNVKRYYERWTEDEVNQLGILVEKYGTKSWDKVVKEMKGRSSIQCQAKWFYESSIRNKGKRILLFAVNET